MGDAVAELLENRWNQVQVIDIIGDTPRLRVLWVVNQQRDTHTFLIDHIIMLESPVLAEALTVVADDHKNRIIITSHLFVLIEDIFDKIIEIMNQIGRASCRERM